MRGPRFKPGMKFKMEKSVYQILVAFRTKDDPNEWKYILENTAPIAKGILEDLLIGSGVADQSGKIVWELLRTSMEAYDVLKDRYSMGDQCIRSNQALLKCEKAV